MLLTECILVIITVAGSQEFYWLREKTVLIRLKVLNGGVVFEPLSQQSTVRIDSSTFSTCFRGNLGAHW